MKKEYLDMLDDIIKEKLESETSEEYMQMKEEKEKYYLGFERERHVRTLEYDVFINKLKSLNYKFGYGKLYRIDKIIELFNEYLFTSSLDDVYIGEGLSIYDYINIAKKYFEILSDNYYHLGIYGYEYLKNKKSKPTLEEVEHLILCKNSWLDYECAELQEALIKYFDPFDVNYIRLLLKLYKIINSHDYDEFIVFKLIEFNMRKELFDFILYAPDSINGWVIGMIYNSKSASIVYNILYERTNIIEFEKENVDLYYFKLLEILKNSTDEYLIEVYNEFKDNDIKNNGSIYDKIELFNQLEVKTFKKLGIVGTYDIGFQESLEIFSSYNILNLKQEKEVANWYDDLEDIDYDVEINNFLNENENSNNEGEYVFKYRYETTDKLSENKMRLLYQEMKNHFLKLDNYISTIKEWNNHFLKIPDIKEIISMVVEKKEIYELEEISSFYSNIQTKYEYDQGAAEKMLLNDLLMINVSGEKYLDLINSYSKVKKTILSASYLWNLYNNSQNMEIDKDGQEYTPIVSNYFKTVELLLYRRIRDKYQKLYNQNILLKKPYSVSGKTINLLDNNDNEFSLGEMLKYLKREKRIFKDSSGLDCDYFVSELEEWINEVRNSHFHKDLILSKLRVRDYKNKTLQLIVDIFNYID